MSTIDKIMKCAYEYGCARAQEYETSDPADSRLVCAERAELRALITAALAEARREGAEAMREKYNAMRQALEVIAVGDSNAPASDAADTLVACDEWRASGLAAARADGSMPLPRYDLPTLDEVRVQCAPLVSAIKSEWRTDHVEDPLPMVPEIGSPEAFAASAAPNFLDMTGGMP